jgi:two-component system phosphate regulon sensor histidine kinase PhoR
MANTEPELDDYRTDLGAAKAAAREMRAEQKKREDFLQSLVHEFRNPLTAMVGALDILKDSLADRLNAKEREFFEIADVSIARLNQMLDEMLEFTALEGREVSLDYEPAVIGALAREVAAEFEPRARIYEVSLRSVIPPDLPKVDCDSEMIRRVLSNLVSNAVKFNKPGGHASITLAKEDTFLRVTVSDTGIGIAPEDQPKIFSRFYRAAGVRAQGIVGTGLGLAIAKNIVDMHGGRISFTSKAGEGTTFTFVIPVTRPKIVPGRRAPR